VAFVEVLRGAIGERILELGFGSFDPEALNLNSFEPVRQNLKCFLRFAGFWILLDIVHLK
jgi:hypothetical protein